VGGGVCVKPDWALGWRNVSPNFMVGIGSDEYLVRTMRTRVVRSH